MCSPKKAFFSEELAGLKAASSQNKNFCGEAEDIYGPGGKKDTRLEERPGFLPKKHTSEGGEGMAGIPLGFCLSMKMKNLWCDFDSGERHVLPTSGTGKLDSIRRITPRVLSLLLEKEVKMPYRVIDCRYSYEYGGGHIVGAINLNTVEQVKSFYREHSTVALIFHCEFSSVRAPFISRFLRNFDRTQNVYPNLRFPEIYILEGGYKAFFSDFSRWCRPRGYVRMHSKAHRKEYVMEETLRRGCKNKKI